MDLSNTSVGIELWRTENSKVLNNTVGNNRGGIILYFSSNNIITGNNANNNNWDGIRLYDSNNNTIYFNNFINNLVKGIFLRESKNNIISKNTCSNNRVGVDFWDSNKNLIYLNNFINNARNTQRVSSIYYALPNTWNSTEEITYIYNGTTYESYLGNYRDDHKGTDAEGDGIGDTHYSIDSDSDESDDYLLTKPFENYVITTSSPA